ncbi:kisspeptin 2 [Myxocyprinus asiaticus]|uniref:kisspeptin 2 n=1 Tax=Myxocyprinus asiaticus TaxID=70543 RepID=UPI00222328DD|nr:kisspeptin 2 [Myxocyprinus asiaticus]
MKIKALVLFLSAVICQSTTMRAPFTYMDTPERTGIPDSKPARFHRFLSMERRESDDPSTSDDASLCFFIKENDKSSQISCKHRLTRSKFNYNPFGLRFGKRNEAITDRSKHKHLLPMILYLRKPETS